jgi:hypothetical protein
MRPRGEKTPNFDAVSETARSTAPPSVVYNAPPSWLKTIWKIISVFLLITLMSQIHRVKHWHSHPIDETFKKHYEPAFESPFYSHTADNHPPIVYHDEHTTSSPPSLSFQNDLPSPLMPLPPAAQEEAPALPLVKVEKITSSSTETVPDAFDGASAGVISAIPKLEQERSAQEASGSSSDIVDEEKPQEQPLPPPTERATAQSSPLPTPPPRPPPPSSRPPPSPVYFRTPRSLADTTAAKVSPEAFGKWRQRPSEAFLLKSAEVVVGVLHCLAHEGPSGRFAAIADTWGRRLREAPPKQSKSDGTGDEEGPTEKNGTSFSSGLLRGLGNRRRRRKNRSRTSGKSRGFGDGNGNGNGNGNDDDDDDGLLTVVALGAATSKGRSEFGDRLVPTAERRDDYLSTLGKGLLG